MSNVFIAAIGEVGLLVTVNLGPNERARHNCPAGEDIELTVGGNQSLNISASGDGPTAEAAPEALPVGADIVEGTDAPPTDDAEGGETTEATGTAEGEAPPLVDLMPDATEVDLVDDPLKNPFAGD